MIRRARPEDADGILAIYAPIVERTTISFETVAPTRGEIERRITAVLETHDWLVAEADGTIAGYAYATAHRPRGAYRHSAEVSAYVHEAHRGKGLATALYLALFESLEARGFHALFAGVALPNAPSVALHRALGFTAVGVFSEVGFKFDAWHDVAYLQRMIDRDV